MEQAITKVRRNTSGTLKVTLILKIASQRKENVYLCVVLKQELSDCTMDDLRRLACMVVESNGSMITFDIK